MNHTLCFPCISITCKAPVCDSPIKESIVLLLESLEVKLVTDLEIRVDYNLTSWKEKRVNRYLSISQSTGVLAGGSDFRSSVRAVAADQ